MHEQGMPPAVVRFEAAASLPGKAPPLAQTRHSHEPRMNAAATANSGGFD
jgi:hypothetical protein